MSKFLLSTLIVACVVFTSCKTGVEEKVVDDCELFTINNFKFYNSRVYDRPIIFEKGSHNLLHKEFVPVWYPGYCAINNPAYFQTKAEYMKYILNRQVNDHDPSYYEHLYESSKANPKGVNNHYHDSYHLLFRGTISVQHVPSGTEFLLVAGKSYIEKEEDYDKNTEFYDSAIKEMFAFKLEGKSYKLVDIDRIFGTFLKVQEDKVYAVLNTKNLLNAVCVENVNTVKKLDFDSNKLPGWVYHKSDLTNE